MTRKNLLAMAVLFAITGAGVAMAADKKADAGKPATPPRGAQLDANGDGFIDKAEAAKAPRLAERFDALDKNKDGKLSRDELPFAKGRGERRKGPRHPGQNVEHGFGGGEPGLGFERRLDADGDGRITREEAKAGSDERIARLFEFADLNKDGVIDQADRELRKAEREKRVKQLRDAWFSSADTDKDGKLSRAEFDAAPPLHGIGRGFASGRPGPMPPKDGRGRLPPPHDAPKDAPGK